MIGYGRFMNTKSMQMAPVEQGLSRRVFLGSLVSGAMVLSLPRISSAMLRRLDASVKIGVIADLHHDVMHDGLDRMKAFSARMAIEKPDAVMQLGDFAYPNAENREVIEQFNRTHRHALHVIGNHDMDAGMTRRNCIDNWGMPARYYEKEIKGVHLLVLDGNDSGSPRHTGGYQSFVGVEQVDWLKKRLRAIDGPIIIASHQPLAGASAVDNAEEIQSIIGQAADKVIMAINGHTHVDDVVRVGGVNYLHVNSASYKWVGGDHRHESYPAAVHEKHPWISYTCPYRDPLFATFTINPETATVVVRGGRTDWVGQSPEDLGVKASAGLEYGRQITPEIRNRQISPTGSASPSGD